MQSRQPKKKRMSEKDTISIIMKLAREQGVEEKVQKLIERFQSDVKGAQTEAERKSIAAMGLAEIHKTIGCVGALIVDGVEVLPEDTGYQDAINLYKGVVKLD